MLKYRKATLIFGLTMLTRLAYCQYEASEYLWSHSDEVLLVRIIKEEPDLLRSITTCTSRVTVEISSVFKGKRFTGDTKQVVFVRLYYCSMEQPITEGDMLRKDKQYALFLSSENPGEFSRAGESSRKIYPLVDNLLGIQEYTKDWEGFLLTKQREKY